MTPKAVVNALVHALPSTASGGLAFLALCMVRALLTGKRLMGTGRLVTDLNVLNEEEEISLATDLLEERKSLLPGDKERKLSADEITHFGVLWHLYRDRLEAAAEGSHLPEKTNMGEELDRILVRTRLAQAGVH